MLSYYLNSFKNILSVFKKITIVFVVFFSVISLFAYFINQDKPKYKPISYDPVKKNREQIYKLVNDKNLNKKREGKIAIGLYRLLTCSMIGEACTNNPEDGIKNYNTSLFGLASNLLFIPYNNPPASGIFWAYEGLHKAGFVSNIYAAEGIGLASIKGFSSIWVVFRNLTYMLLVLVIIAIGFMIMFRMKLNPQTVISVESALPRIVIALLLITFSFAIAGFMIDLMYVIMALAIAALSQSNVGDLNPANMLNLQNKYIGATMIDIWPYEDRWGFSAFSAGAALFQIMPGIIQAAFNGIVGFAVGLGLVRFFSSATYERFLNGLGNINLGAATFLLGIGELPSWITILIDIMLFMFVINFVPAIIFGIVILLTLGFFIFRVFFMLLQAYIRVVIYIIFAPIIILFEAIPGYNAFGWWLKNLFGELLTFPIVAVLSLVGYAIIQVNSSSTSQPFSLPFLSGFSSEDLGVLVGLGLVLITPDFVKMIKGLLGIKELPLNIGLGTFFAGASAPAGGLLSMGAQYGSLALAFPRLRTFAQTLPGIGAVFKEAPKKPEPPAGS